MNKPARPPVPDADLGPLDADGQQIWSPEEREAIERAISASDHAQGIAEAEADIAAGRLHTREEVAARVTESKRCWRAIAVREGSLDDDGTERP